MEAVIRLLSGKKEEGSRDDLAQFIMGTSWRYLSFFIYQTFAFEQISLFDSLKRSTHLFKKYFGTVSGSLFTLSALGKVFPWIVLGILSGTVLLMGAIERLCIAIGWGSFDDIFFSGLDEKTATTYLMLGLVIPYFALLFFFIGQIIFTAQDVMSTLLYRHINQQSTGFLRSEVLEAAIREVK